MDRFFSFFVGRFKNNPEDYSRAKLVVKFTLVELAVILMDTLFYKHFNFHIPIYLFIGFAIVLFSTLLLFRLQFSLDVIANTMIGTMWAGFVWGIAISGGIFSVLLPWLILMPVMANLLVGHSCSKSWFVVSALSILFFMFFFKNPQVMINPLGDRRAFISYFALVFVIFALTDLFHRAEVKLLNKIKEVNKDLTSLNEEVISQNEGLTTQRDELSAQRNFIEKQNKKLIEQNRNIERVNDLLAAKVHEITTRNSMLEKHWHTLLDISKSKNINFGNFDESLKHIIKTAAQSLQTDRVSIWYYNGDRSSLQCLMLYRLDEDKFSIQEELLATDFPRYFEALREEEIIPADDAETDSHTFEFRDSYLKPHHILSMMDTPFFLDGKLGGVLCCEHQSNRHWIAEDIIFAQALSDIITIVFKTQQRRRYEKRIRDHRREIARINQSLEDRVRERTQILEEKNQQLSEYAFINSHLLRAPLSRILGLVNLLEYSENKETQLISHLKLSSEELDEVVKRINGAIDEGTHFNREQFGNFEKKRNEDS